MEQTAVDWFVDRIKHGGLVSKKQFDELLEQAKEMEMEQKHKSIDKQVGILKDTLEELMTGFDSEEDRMDFILDICNGYRKRINI